MEETDFQKASKVFNETLSELISINTKILSQQDNFLSKCKEGNDSNFFIPLVKTMKLKNKDLVFTFEKEEIMKCNLNEYFKKISNVFNDVFPFSNKYSDLSLSIEKLSLLNPLKERTNEIVMQWKLQLGLILEFFTKKSDEIEKKIRKENEKKLFFLQELKIQVEFCDKYTIIKKRNSIENFEFELQLTEESDDELRCVVNILKNNFSCIPIEMQQLFHEYENEGRKILILKCNGQTNLNVFDDYPKKLQCEWYKPTSSEDAQILIDKCSELSRQVNGNEHMWILTKYVEADPIKRTFGGYNVKLDNDGNFNFIGAGGGKSQTKGGIFHMNPPSININVKKPNNGFTAIKKGNPSFATPEMMNNENFQGCHLFNGNFFFLVLQK